MIESIVISYSVNVSLDASITRIKSRGIRRVVQIILKRRLDSGFVLERTAGLGTRRSFGVGVRYVSIGRAFRFLVGWRIAFYERGYPFDHA